MTVQGGSWEVLVNETGAKLLQSNLLWLGPPAYTADEQAFAKQIQRATGVPEVGMVMGVKPLEGQEPQGGSTDVADVSWIAPTLHVTVATSPMAAPWHAWPVVATAGMSIGHKGMIQAAKTLAATMVDLYEQPASAGRSAGGIQGEKGQRELQIVRARGPAAAAEGLRSACYSCTSPWWLASDPSRRPAVNPARPGREQR